MYTAVVHNISQTHRPMCRVHREARNPSEQRPVPPLRHHGSSPAQDKNSLICLRYTLPRRTKVNERKLTQIFERKLRTQINKVVPRVTCLVSCVMRHVSSHCILCPVSCVIILCTDVSCARCNETRHTIHDTRHTTRGK